MGVDVEKIIKDYYLMKKEMAVLKFQLENFAGVSDDDLISSMSLGHQEGERVQNSQVSDKTAHVAMNYNAVSARLNDEMYDCLLEQYRELQAETEFFEYSLTCLSGRLPEIMKDLVIDKMSWAAMAEKYRVSHMMIGKYRKKAMEELAEIYAARSRHMQKYILS